MYRSVVAVGVAALIAQSPMVMATLTVAGAGYMLWLGIDTLSRPSAPLAGGEAPGSWVRQAVKRLGTAGFNPKVFLLFLALLPQFTDRNAAWPVPAQILLLGLVHVASCAVIYTAAGTGARLVLLARPAAARAVTRFSGAAMVVIGVLLLVERLVG
jgi:threonine/homoserine/homoserine lactone efflux protein